MNYIIIIKAVLALLPAIIDAVKAIEAAFPQSGQGQNKLAAIRGIVESAYNIGEGAVVNFEKLWPVIQSAIGYIVGLANATGLFKK